MKKYTVIVQPPAIDDLDEAYQWILERSPQHAVKWFNDLMDSLQSLQHNPERCAVAPENDAVEPEIRQLLYGKRWNVYRVLFTIRRSEVHVLHIRHAARHTLTEDELSDDIP